MTSEYVSLCTGQSCLIAAGKALVSGSVIKRNDGKGGSCPDCGSVLFVKKAHGGKRFAEKLRRNNKQSERFY